METKRVEQKIKKIRRLIKELLLFEADSPLIPEYENWNDSYRVRKKLVNPTISKLEETVVENGKEILSSFRFCMNEEDYEWCTLFIAQTLARNAEGEILREVITSFLTDDLSPHISNAIHDGFLERKEEIVPHLTEEIKARISAGDGKRAHQLLSILSKVRSDAAFKALRKFLSERETLNILAEEDFLRYFLNQGRGADILQKSVLMEILPERTKETIQQLESNSYPSDEELFKLPKVKHENTSNVAIIKNEWGYEAATMDDCIGCGKETKSHLLPKGHVMCHTCWEEGRASDFIEESITERMQEVNSQVRDEDIEKELYKNLAEVNMDLGYMEETEGIYETLLEKYPEPTFFTRYGEILHTLGNAEQEEELYNKMIAKWPYHATGYQKLATLLREKGKHEAAIYNLTRALDIQVNNNLAYPEDGSLHQLEENIAALTACVEKTYPELRPKKEEKSLKEEGLLPEEEEFLKEEGKEKTPIKELQEKLLAIKTMRRKLRMDERLEELRLGEIIDSLKEKNFLATLETMVKQHPPNVVITHLESILQELEEGKLDYILLELLTRLDTDRVIPLQYYFMDATRFSEMDQILFNALADRGDVTYKFLKAELRAGRVPKEKIGYVWDILREESEEEAVNAFLEYIEEKEIKPYDLNRPYWDYLLEVLLPEGSFEGVSKIYEKLMEKVKWHDAAHNYVEKCFERWKQHR